MKRNLKNLLLLLLFAVCSSVFAGENAAPTWGDSMGYSSVAEQSLTHQRAYTAFLMRRGALQGATVYNDQRTIHDNSVTECRVAGSCQSGGSATNINGMVSVTGGTGNNTVVDVETQDTNQSANATTVSVPEQNGQIEFGIGALAR